MKIRITLLERSDLLRRHTRHASMLHAHIHAIRLRLLLLLLRKLLLLLLLLLSLNHQLPLLLHGKLWIDLHGC